MALIKHIAIATDDPKKLAEYYADVFGLKITDHGVHGDYWLTDGYIDFALIPHSPTAAIRPASVISTSPWKTRQRRLTSPGKWPSTASK